MTQESFFNSGVFQEALKEVGFRMDAASKRNVEIFGKTWYGKHFKMADYAKTREEFTALLGQFTLSYAASTINRNSAPPVRPTDGFGKVKAEMLTFAHTYPMYAEDIRAIAEYMRYYNRASERRQVVEYIVNKLWNVRERAINGVNERLDLIILSMLSNKGQFTFSADNDPNSPFVGKTIGFGFDEGHAANVSADWSAANAATVDVIGDISEAVSAMDVKPEIMLMDKATARYMLTTTVLKKYINGNDMASRPIVLSQVNDILNKLDLPAIEVIEKKVRVLDGDEDKYITPWTSGKILFVPSADFGTIEHLVTDHDLGIDDPGITYNKSNHIEVKSWIQGLKEGTHHTEFVSAELTGTPVWKSALDSYLIDTLPSTRG